MYALSRWAVGHNLKHRKDHERGIFRHLLVCETGDFPGSVYIINETISVEQ
jgi:hypothetical protein